MTSVTTRFYCRPLGIPLIICNLDLFPTNDECNKREVINKPTSAAGDNRKIFNNNSSPGSFSILKFQPKEIEHILHF